MTHLETGTLMSYLDGEIAGDEAKAVDGHLTSCDSCRAEAAALRTDRDAVTSVLSRWVDIDPNPVAARVRARIRSNSHTAARAGGASPFRRRSPAWASRSRLLRAAIMILFTAGGVAALATRSPLRQWLAPAGTELPGPSITAEPSTAAGDVQVSAAPIDGRLTVSVEIPSGSALTVALIDGNEATVHAAEGAQFTRAGSVLEVTIPVGSVRVELPRNGGDVSLQVAGQVYVRVLEGRLEVVGPAVQRSDTVVSLTAP